MKFLAIVSGNLDEFFMKRIGGLKQVVLAGRTETTVDGRTPAQQITDAHTVIRGLHERKNAIYQTLLALLAEKGIRLLRITSYNVCYTKLLRGARL